MTETAQLWLLRHAKSAWDTAASDFDRPLTDRGKRDASRMGRWMAQQGLIPDQILASPAKRARQTVKRVCRELGIDLDRVCWDERIYEAEAEDLLALLRAFPLVNGKILLVGHNPGLVELLESLGKIAPVGEIKLLPTAALARLAVAGNWCDLKPGAGHLLGIMRPRELPSEF